MLFRQRPYMEASKHLKHPNQSSRGTISHLNLLVTSDCSMTENHLDINIFQILPLYIHVSNYHILFWFCWIFGSFCAMEQNVRQTLVFTCCALRVLMSEGQWGKEDWTVQTNQLHHRMKLLFLYLLPRLSFLHWGSHQCTKHKLKVLCPEDKAVILWSTALWVLHASSQLLFLCTVR